MVRKVNIRVSVELVIILQLGYRETDVLRVLVCLPTCTTGFSHRLRPIPFRNVRVLWVNSRTLNQLVHSVLLGNTVQETTNGILVRCILRPECLLPRQLKCASASRHMLVFRLNFVSLQVLVVPYVQKMQGNTTTLLIPFLSVCVITDITNRQRMCAVYAKLTNTVQHTTEWFMLQIVRVYPVRLANAVPPQ